MITTKRTSVHSTFCEVVWRRSDQPSCHLVGERRDWPGEAAEEAVVAERLRLWARVVAEVEPEEPRALPEAWGPRRCFREAVAEEAPEEEPVARLLGEPEGELAEQREPLEERLGR